jgi:[ribosomal protein S5]-alanine N-acetyltransferase
VSDWSLETSRLRIRPLAPGDLDALAQILGDIETMSFYPRAFTHAETREWIERNRRRYDEEGLGLWALELRATGACVGNCGPVRQVVDGRDEIELGWHVNRLLWGRGLATEAAAACRDYCFDELGISRLIALVRPVNLPSRRVAEKIGMAVEKETFWGNFQHLVYVARAHDDRDRAGARRRVPST